MTTTDQATKHGEFLAAVGAFETHPGYVACISEYIEEGSCDWQDATCQVWASRLDDQDADFIDFMAERGFTASIKTLRGIPKPGWTSDCGGFSVTFEW